MTIYIDDSGSAPEHKVVVASAIIIPAKSLLDFEREWKFLLGREGVSEFHTSECLAGNEKSYPGWDRARSIRVIRKARKISLKYSIKGFCIAIYKKDYDEIMPEDMRARIGSYYTWALSSVLGQAYDWATKRSVSIEYVLDAAGKDIKREVDEAMEFSGRLYPGHFMGRYAFRDRRVTPALQAADLFAWTCFQMGRRARADQPIPEIAEENWIAYRKARNRGWSKVESLTREGIKLWVERSYLGPSDLQIKEFKDEKKAARIQIRKPKK